MKGPNSSHSSINGVFDIRRFDTNMESGQVGEATVCYDVQFVLYIYTVILYRA